MTAQEYLLDVYLLQSNLIISLSHYLCILVSLRLLHCAKWVLLTPAAALEKREEGRGQVDGRDNLHYSSSLSGDLFKFSGDVIHREAESYQGRYVWRSVCKKQTYRVSRLSTCRGNCGVNWSLVAHCFYAEHINDIKLFYFLRQTCGSQPPWQQLWLRLQHCCFQINANVLTTTMLTY